MAAGADRAFWNRYAGLSFLASLVWFGLAVAVGAPFLWPFMEPGRRLSVLLGCRTLACVPLGVGLGFLLSLLVALGIGGLVGAGLARSPIGGQ